MNVFNELHSLNTFMHDTAIECIMLPVTSQMTKRVASARTSGIKTISNQ